jgi:hypothetical protein
MIKRVSFSTISSTALDAGSVGINSLAGKKDKKVKKEKTIRFDLKLNESTTESFPEYSFKELLKSASGDNQEDFDDPLDPLDDPQADRKLKELAQQFNDKYGPKKNKYGVIEDYIDKGLGYDENDSFIDNEEAYDELIPSTITTKHGGFYINFGQLEFKPISGVEDGDENDFNHIKSVVKKVIQIENQHLYNSLHTSDNIFLFLLLFYFISNMV